MKPDDAQPMRRVTITLVRSRLSASFGIRPTIVIEGRAQPTQWGEGTWLLPADRPSTVGVFLYFRGLRWARATHELRATDAPRLEYRLGPVRARMATGAQ